MPEPTPSDAELDAAIAAITDPARLAAAQSLVTRAAPQLQRVLATALQEGGWFAGGHEQAIREATAPADPADRQRAVQTLVAEETRLGMLVGVAVGFALADELGTGSAEPESPTDRSPTDA